MKKIISLALVVILAITLGLWIFAKVSSAHQAATTAIFNPQVFFNQRIGVVEQVLLAQVNQKTGPSGKGCSTLTYYLFGSRNNGWVNIRLFNDSYRGQWKVVEIKEGYNSVLTTDCVYG